MAPTGEGSSKPAVRTLTPPIPPVVFRAFINPLLRRVLRSPLHRLVSDHLLLITVTGRRSGRQFTTPVGYEAVDDALYVTSQTDRNWWRNLRGGAAVTVHHRGEARRATATVIEDDRAVAGYVEDFVDRHGIEGLRRLAIAVDGGALPPTDVLADGLADVVVVRIDLDDAA